jgi:hypothetical protein
VRHPAAKCGSWSLAWPFRAARAEQLDFVETDPVPTHADVVDRLRRGEITVPEALAELERPR